MFDESIFKVKTKRLVLGLSKCGKFYVAKYEDGSNYESPEWNLVSEAQCFIDRHNGDGWGSFYN